MNKLMKKVKLSYLLAFFLLTGIFYVDVQGQSNYPNQLMIPYRSGQLWGYCDTLGKVLLEPQYDSTGFFDLWQRDFAMIKKAGKYGLIDKKFSIAVPIEHETLQTFVKYDQKYMILSVNGKMGVTNMAGDTVIAFKYDGFDLSYLSEVGALLTLKNGKWGIVSVLYWLNIEPEYDSLAMTNQPYWEPQGGFIGKKGDNYFLIKTNGETFPIMNTTTNAVSVPSRSKLVKFKPETKLPTNIINQLRKIEPTLKDTARISKILYDRPLDYSTGSYEYVLVQKGKKVAALDLSRQKIATGYYDDIVESITFLVQAPIDGPVQDLPYYQLLLVKNNGKYGVLNESEKQISPFIYDGFGKIGGSYIVTKQKKKQGAILLFTIYPPIPCKYDSIDFERSMRVSDTWSFGVYRATLNGKTGYIGENGIEYFK